MSTIRHQAGTTIAGEKTGGQFKSAERTVAAGDALAGADPQEKVNASVQYQRWDSWDNVEVVSEEDVDLGALFDALPLDQVPEKIEHDEADEFFYKAQKIGVVSEHDGPFTLSIDHDDLAAYRTRREHLGQVERGIPGQRTFNERATLAHGRVTALDDQIASLHRKREQAAHAYIGSTVRALVPDAHLLVLIRSDTDDVSYAPDSVYEISGAISTRDGQSVFTDLSVHSDGFSEVQTLLDQSPQYFYFESLPEEASEHSTIAIPWDGELMSIKIES